MDLVTAAGSPYSAQQNVNFGYLILHKTGNFGQDIREWNRLLPAQKTWDAFQTHFTTEYQALRDTGELLNHESSFHTTNIIQEVVEGVQQALTPTLDDIAETNELIHQTNASTSHSTQQTELLQKMIEMMQTMQFQMATNLPTLHST